MTQTDDPTTMPSPSPIGPVPRRDVRDWHPDLGPLDDWIDAGEGELPTPPSASATDTLTELVEDFWSAAFQLGRATVMTSWKSDSVDAGRYKDREKGKSDAMDAVRATLYTALGVPLLSVPFISEARVEAGAIALFLEVWSGPPSGDLVAPEWNDMPKATKAHYRNRSRTVLTAAFTVMEADHERD